MMGKKVRTKIVAASTLMTEKELLRSIVDAAREMGWKVYHSWTSIHSPRGYPDLFMVKDGRALAFELKSARGKVTEAQQSWLDALSGVPGVEARVVRPDDLEDAYRRLAGLRTLAEEEFEASLPKPADIRGLWKETL